MNPTVQKLAIAYAEALIAYHAVSKRDRSFDDAGPELKAARLALYDAYAALNEACRDSDD